MEQAGQYLGGTGGGREVVNVIKNIILRIIKSVMFKNGIFSYDIL